MCPWCWGIPEEGTRSPVTELGMIVSWHMGVGNQTQLLFFARLSVPLTPEPAIATAFLRLKRRDVVAHTCNSNLRRLKQEDCFEFEVSLEYIVSFKHTLLHRPFLKMFWGGTIIEV